MKAYGVRKKDAGCCGGHDKHPSPALRYNNQRGASFRRADRGRKKRARMEARQIIKTLVS